jgi:hypothetical protein
MKMKMVEVFFRPFSSLLDGLAREVSFSLFLFFFLISILLYVFKSLFQIKILL